MLVKFLSNIGLDFHTNFTKSEFKWRWETLITEAINDPTTVSPNTEKQLQLNN